MSEERTMPEWVKNKLEKPFSGERKYPFNTMALYEVFSVNGGDAPADGWKGIKRCARNEIRNGKKFVHRKLPDGTIEVCRVK